MVDEGDREVWMLFSLVVGRPERRKREEGGRLTGNYGGGVATVRESEGWPEIRWLPVWCYSGSNGILVSRRGGGVRWFVAATAIAGSGEKRERREVRGVRSSAAGRVAGKNGEKGE
ncbi:hypothetical protein HAX54_020014 [Datura stramonium]|uniref:Uncharacterized protein n=1 Tax=Datura stramonium TaxID=4076 RepID=A0ABS8USI5_DATST|nr:hypothetical protein [Datura stramonium]